MFPDTRLGWQPWNRTSVVVFRTLLSLRRMPPFSLCTRPNTLDSELSYCLELHMVGGYGMPKSAHGLSINRRAAAGRVYISEPADRATVDFSEQAESPTRPADVTREAQVVTTTCKR